MKKYMKLLAVVLVVAMLAACLSACGSKQDSSEPAANTSDSSTKDTASTGSGELVIGDVGPLTGDYAVYGTAVKNTAQQSSTPHRPRWPRTTPRAASTG